MVADLAPRWLQRGIIVVVSLACSAGLALALRGVLHDKAQLLPFTLAVIVSSTYGGLIEGLAATVLSFAIADFFFIEPVYEVLTGPGDFALLFVFLIFGISLSIVNHARARASLAAIERSRELARSNEELQRFAYSVSHDLQEPLRSIGMFTSLFLKKHGAEFDGESSRWLEFVRAGAERMQALIDAILEFSVAGRGSERAVTQAEVIARLAVRDLNTAIQTSQAEVRVSALPVVWADEKQLGRVFLNLIGNAIKHHRGERPVEIVISAESRPGEWVFSVKDNGAGVDAEHRSRIFEAFHRVNGSGGGHGLGLAACKRIIEQHGGRIWVESEPGQGANFRFTIPKSKG